MRMSIRFSLVYLDNSPPSNTQYVENVLFRPGRNDLAYALHEFRIELSPPTSHLRSASAHPFRV